ncbi:DUF5719 family protein [Microbacterium soli]|uniref:Large extracellular alpha-helical protein n=1 Tax=Microbacterium soli TaxID=446075 RepID=A0ABP7MPP4_9MICO
MSRRTIRPAAGARVLLGAALAAASVLAVVAAVAAPWPQVRGQQVGTTVTPVPRDTVLVCNGSFRVLGREAARAELMVSAAAPSLRIDGEEDAATSVELSMPDVTGGTGAQAVIGRIAARSVPQVAASESVRLAEPDATGFAAAPCREPSLEGWIVGGDVSTGASDIILLSNPGVVTATVDLDVYGTTRSASTVVVPPQTQLGVPLAAVAAGAGTPVVRVTATGAPVRAVLQSTLVRALDPIGVDLQDSVSGTQRQQTILGVRAASAAPGDDHGGVVVRMLAPEADARATVRVRASESSRILDEYSIDLVEATPTEITLAGLAEGDYDIDISATSPVVSAVRQTMQTGSIEDFAWSLPSPQLAGETTIPFSVPNGPAAELHLRNPGQTPVTVELHDIAGGSGVHSPISLPGGGSAAVRLDPGGYALSPSGAVSASVGMRDGTGIAAWPLWAAAATQQPIIVRP